MITPTALNTIILIGPISAGKSTVGKTLAARLGCSFSSLDDLERSYTVKLGYDHDYAMQLAEEEGGFAWYAYRRSFFEPAVLKFLVEHQSGVLELGGGHPIMPEKQSQMRVKAALKPFRNVILLMPCENVQQSLQILNERLNLPEHTDDLNTLLLQDRTFFEIAKHVIYTRDKSVDAICDEMLGLLSSAR